MGKSHPAAARGGLGTPGGKGSTEGVLGGEMGVAWVSALPLPMFIIIVIKSHNQNGKPLLSA